MVISGSTKLDSLLVSSWKEGIDYEETLAPMGRYTSIMALAAKLEWKIHQMDEEAIFCMVWLKTKCTWSNHWDSRHMTDSHMCIDGRKLCTG